MDTKNETEHDVLSRNLLALRSEWAAMPAEMVTRDAVLGMLADTAEYHRRAGERLRSQDHTLAPEMSTRLEALEEREKIAALGILTLGERLDRLESGAPPDSDGVKYPTRNEWIGCMERLRALENACEEPAAYPTPEDRAEVSEWMQGVQDAVAAAKAMDSETGPSMGVVIDAAKHLLSELSTRDGVRGYQPLAHAIDVLSESLLAAASDEPLRGACPQCHHDQEVAAFIRHRQAMEGFNG